ncbi:hypothetical protein PINS_up002188 [Pythium insidiosum]|nr:hypothetical protein PINS_up002188 [Pythium insidiosum]
MNSDAAVDDQPAIRSREITITGSADPITLRVSYRQPVDGHDDVVTVCVTACNTTNMALSDFELQIRSQGPVRCIDPSNDTKIRLLSAGAASASTVAPFGTIKGEKRFLLQRFATATFFFHVTFQEVESGSGEDGGQPLTMRLAATNPFVVRVDALMRAPSPQTATAAFFQSAWQVYVAFCIENRRCKGDDAVHGDSDDFICLSTTALKTALCSRLSYLKTRNPRSRLHITSWCGLTPTASRSCTSSCSIFPFLPTCVSSPELFPISRLLILIALVCVFQDLLACEDAMG